MNPSDPAIGPNQHFLPRFLQRGFASGRGGRNPLVWYFPRNESISHQRINTIGADAYFYGHPSESPVDERLKARENDFGAMVFKLRKAKASQVIENQLMPELFAHMAVRTKNLRQTFGDSAAELMKRMAAQSDTPEGQARIQRKTQSMIDDEIAKILDQRPYKSLLSRLTHTDRDRLLAQFKAHARNLDIASLFGPALRAVSRVVDFAEAASDGHIKALTKLDDGVPPRIDALKPLSWSLVVCDAGSFILGDIAVMVQAKHGDALQSPLKENETPFAIVLPISDRHLLAGSQEGPLFVVDADLINRASAELSVDFFIASRRTEREERYVSRLGVRSALFNSTEMDEIVRSAVEGF